MVDELGCRGEGTDGLTWLHSTYKYSMRADDHPFPSSYVSIFSPCKVHSSDAPQVYEQRPGVLLQHAQLNQL